MNSALASLSLFITGAVALAWITLTVVLNHHWTKFEVDARRVRRARAMYFGVSGVFFLFLALTIIALQ